MARLIVSVDDIVIKEHTLTKERTTIGRKAAADVRIEDTHLSGEHAQVLLIGHDYVYEDLDSTNGSIINGKPTISAMRSAKTIGVGLLAASRRLSNPASWAARNVASDRHR